MQYYSKFNENKAPSSIYVCVHIYVCMWLVSRCPPKASCSHRWVFLEVARSRVCNTGIDSWYIAGIKGTGIKSSRVKGVVPLVLNSLDKLKGTEKGQKIT